MKYLDFEQMIGQLWEQIPAAFKEGISALQVLRGSRFDPELDDCPVFGDCGPDLTLDFVPDAPLVSTIRIFYGSFRLIAREEPDFDWEAEAWETLLHELRHHLDWRSNRDGLGELDDLQREKMARDQGKDFDPEFYRFGPRLLTGVTSVEDELFVEVLLPSKQWAHSQARDFWVDAGGWRFFSTALREDWSEELRAVRIEDAEQMDDVPVIVLTAFEDVTVLLRRRPLASLSARRPRLHWL